MRALIVVLVLLAASVWLQSEQNDCQFHGTSAEQWLECLVR